jgi:hypothetical protein
MIEVKKELVQIDKVTSISSSEYGNVNCVTTFTLDFDTGNKFSYQFRIGRKVIEPVSVSINILIRRILSIGDFYELVREFKLYCIQPDNNAIYFNSQLDLIEFLNIIENLTEY